MQKFKTLLTSRQYGIIGVTVLAVGVTWPLVGAAQDKSDKAQDPAARRLVANDKGLLAMDESNPM